MRSIFAALLVASSFSFVACAAQSDHEAAPASDEVDAEGNAISHHDAKLLGAYTLVAGDQGPFTNLVLREDGIYFSETQIECFRAPCINPRETGTWKSTDFSKKTAGTLSLKADGASSAKQYKVALAKDSSGMTLTRSGVTSRYSWEINFCDDTTDCAGQKVYALGIMCMKGSSYHMVCATASHTCETKCMSDKPCEVTGCGVKCQDETKVCSVMYRADVLACYANTGKCGRDETGQCAWLNQAHIDACLDASN